jgi:hypothetical protein
MGLFTRGKLALLRIRLFEAKSQELKRFSSFWLSKGPRTA